MLRLEFKQLPLHHQTLYKLLASLLAGAFSVGLIWILLGLSDQRIAEDNGWQPTAVPAGEDVNAQFAAISGNMSWYQDEKAVRGGATSMMEDDTGAPEGFRLAGLVKNGDVRYALFLPPASGMPNQEASIIQRAEGDILVDGWVIKLISSSHVELQQGEDIKHVKLYDPSLAQKTKPKQRR